MFRTNPDLRYIGKGLFELRQPLWWDGNIHTVVPPGATTDFASIPRILRPIMPVIDDHILPAILHDHLYTVRPRACTRAQADAEFLEAMKVQGVRFTRRWAMYLGVRIGGWIAWNKYRDDE